MDSELIEFYSSDIVRITGVKQTRLHGWIERGWIRPSVQKGVGTGSKNIYNRFDLYNIEMFKQLVSQGLPRKVIASYIQAMISLHSHFTGSVIDVIEFWAFGRKGDIFYAEDISSDCLGEPIGIFLRQNFIRKTPFYDSIFLLNFRRIREQVDAKIKEIKG